MSGNVLGSQVAINQTQNFWSPGLTNSLFYTTTFTPSNGANGYILNLPTNLNVSTNCQYIVGPGSITSGAVPPAYIGNVDWTTPSVKVTLLNSSTFTGCNYQLAVITQTK
jgi:hypothetical protein